MNPVSCGYLYRLGHRTDSFLHRQIAQSRVARLLITQNGRLKLKLTPFHGHFIVLKVGVRDVQTAFR